MDKEKKKKEMKGVDETEDLIYELAEAEKREEEQPKAEGAEKENPSEEAAEKKETEEAKKEIKETEGEEKEEESEPEKKEDPKELEKDTPADEAAETIRGMIESLGAEKVLSLIIGNRNAAIEQIVEEMQAQADEMPMRSGPSADGRYRSIFELASYA